MTAIGIAHHVAVRPAMSADTRLRITTRGRRVLAGIVAFPLIVAVAAAIVGGGAALASREDGAAAGSFATVTVVTGDSLWSIAEEVAPQADPRDVVSAFERLNALNGGMIAAGQKLAVPAEYTPVR